MLFVLSVFINCPIASMQFFCSIDNARFALGERVGVGNHKLLWAANKQWLDYGA